MFNKETYIERRRKVMTSVGSGILLFLGNDEMGLNYADNAFRYRQDSSMIYFFGMPYPELAAVLDIDEGREILFGDELSIDSIVWMGTQPTLAERAARAGITDIRPLGDIAAYLSRAREQGRTIHFLPPYRPEHRLKLMDWLGLMPSSQIASVPFIKAVVELRNHKTAEEIAEIERACGKI